MPKEILDRITPLSCSILCDALLTRWETLKVPVLRHAIELKIAHIHLETGLKACHNYNLGNVKSRSDDGCDWQYFSCGEEIEVSKLKYVQSLGPRLVVVKASYVRNLVPWVSISIMPRHPWSKFKAFATLAEGLEGQLAYLYRHPMVLSALQTGDPAQYNEALFAAGYYTADGARYGRGLKQRLQIVRKDLIDFDWGDVT